MNKYIIFAAVLFVTTFSIPAVGLAQGGSCDAGGGTEGTLVDGKCVAVSQSSQPPSSSNQPVQQKSQYSGFTALAPIPGLTDTSNTSAINETSLANFLNNLYKYLIGLAALLAIGEIIYAGIKIATNQDNVSTITESKGRIGKALLGLILVLAPVLVFSIINPSILNLSVNIPKLDTASPALNKGNVTQNAPATTDTSSGCSVSGVSGILQIATCPSDAAAKAWGQSSCTGRLSGITALTQNMAGNTSVVITCAGTKNYMFVNTKPWYSPYSTIVRLQPLARSNIDSSNGDSAVQFANICSSIGWKTCLETPTPRTCVSVAPVAKTQLPANVTMSCSEYTLACRDASWLFNDTCSINPGWTPFQ